jgi:copper(I)-binding protein
MKKLMSTLFFVGLCSNFAFAQTAVQQQTTNTAQSMSMTRAQAVPAQPIAASELTITGAYVQPLIPGQNNTAAYMTINNQTKATYVLTGAASPMAQSTQLHTVIMQESMMKMRPVDYITLPPGQKVMLQPGDFHVMLMGVNTDLNQDTLVPICLEFKDSDTMCINAPVEDRRSKNPQDNAIDHAHH